MVDAADVEAIFGELVDDGLAFGWQMFAVGRRGELCLWGGTDALGRGLRERSLFRPYCAIKPLLAVIVGALVDGGLLSFDSVLGDILDVGGALSRVTVVQLLSHRSGVQSPSAVRVIATPQRERASLALSSGKRLAPCSPGESRYTEAAAWMLLAAVAEAAAGAPLGVLAHEVVLTPLGMEAEFDLRPDIDLRRLGVNVCLQGDRVWPMYIERTSFLGWEDNPGFGGAVTARGLVSLAVSTLQSASDEGGILRGPTARALVSAQPAVFDSVLEMHISYGLGWMTNLPEIDFGPALSTESFGHVGLTGMTAMWADPLDGHAGCYHINGLIDGYTAVNWLRPRLVGVISRAVT